jgi:hypothetical protein
VRRPFRPEQVRTGRFRDYLKAVLRNAVITHFRRGAQQPDTAGDLGALVAADVETDREWLEEWRGCLLQRAWAALEMHERSAPQGIAYTALRLAADHPDESSDVLAARASELTGRSVGAVAFRKQLSRARRRFAQLLVDEVRQTLKEGRAEAVVEELADLRLMELVRDFLPEPFRGAARGQA